LTISRRLVEMMGGHIWVDSVPGSGSTFCFTALFAVASEAAPVTPYHEVFRHAATLIVDDNATNRSVLAHMLQHWGIACEMAASGPEALELLRSRRAAGGRFDLLLIDCCMPEMDGFELAEGIRTASSVAAPKIIMLTSSAQPGHADRCRESGIAAYLIKPIRQAELLDAVIQVIGGKQSTRHAPAPAAASNPQPARRGRILLVEDNVINQKVRARMLESGGHEVAVAENGKVALQMLCQSAFDLVLMDEHMPEMNGIETTRIIRQQEERSGEHIPIIAVTAAAMQGDRNACLAAGMDDYLTKPLGREALLAAIDRHLAGVAVVTLR
jgi:CheY-like chemotaxis protein